MLEQTLMVKITAEGHHYEWQSNADIRKQKSCSDPKGLPKSASHAPPKGTELSCQNTLVSLVAPPKAPPFVIRPSALKARKRSARTLIPKSRCTRLHSPITCSASIKMTGEALAS